MPISPVGAPRSAGSRLVLFDLDRTLLPGSSLVVLARRLAADGLLAPAQLARACARQLVFSRRGATAATAERACASALALVEGFPAAVASEAMAFAAIEVVSLLRPCLLERARNHREAGDRCVILSASPHELVVAVADGAGFDHGVGTRLEARDGQLTGRLDGPFCHAEGKLARLRDELGDVDLRTAVAYADAGTDLPVLEACGFAVAVNPDRALRAVARRSGWPVLRL